MNLSKLGAAEAAAALLLLASFDAQAYIDPGTGSLLVQGLIAAIAAGAVAVRSYWFRIRTFFRPEKPAPKADPPDGHSGTPE